MAPNLLLLQLLALCALSYSFMAPQSQRVRSGLNSNLHMASHEEFPSIPPAENETATIIDGQPIIASIPPIADDVDQEEPLIPMDDDDSDDMDRKSEEQVVAKRKMDLMLCGRETCKEVIRERVVGPHNNLEFEGPATGQVCYVWDEEDVEANKNIKQSVLMLVKRGDEALVEVAAEAIKELSKKENLEIHVAPEICAKLKHRYGVDDDKIKLFEPAPEPGFGGNHVAMDDELMGEYNLMSSSGDTPNPDLVCTLGGDGLLMHASMMFQGSCPPILCVAGGSLGFLTRFTRDEMVEAIQIALGLSQGKEDDVEFLDPTEIRPSYKLLKESMSSFNLGLGKRICISMRMRLDVRVINREGVVRARFNVLNEVVIDRGASPYLAALECFVDDLHLTTVQADGIIFATPTGSTAYSMAAGGSVVHPAVPGILITPICPHVLSFRSMVFPDSVVLRCYVPDDARSDASVSFDGRYRRVLHRGDSVQVQMSQYPVPTINRADHSADWLSSLKENFNFNSRARQKPI